LTIADPKTALRALARSALAGADPKAGHTLARQVLEALPMPPGIIAGVWPLPGEMDLRPLLHALHGTGRQIVLPQTPPRGQRLIFRIWHPDAVMIQERFGTAYPDGEIAEPDILFVPLLAFDRRGFRLGYGGGYYDRTLAALPGRLSVGYGYAAQEVASVPVEPHDVALQVIATEQGIIDLRSI
jgi:5-formyltetrahydrofolate cyclo-ligase